DTAAGAPPSAGCLRSCRPDPVGPQLGMRDDVTGDPEHVIQFVKRCALAFGLTGLWGVQYASTCSKAVINAFGGGAHVLDLATGETVAWTYTDGWLAEILDRGAPAG